MIIVKFTSGLGNQMFQYNLYSYLRKKYPKVRVLADVTWFGRSGEHQGFELLKLFKRDDNKDFFMEMASHKDILRCTGRIPNTLDGWLGDLWQNILKVPHAIIRKKDGDKYIKMHIDQSGFEDNSQVYEKLMNIDPEKDWYISGFFIEEVYYKDRLDELRRELSFEKITAGDNFEIAKKIEACHSVSIHVRRGDYLSPKYNQDFIALGMEYYKAAVKCAMEENQESHFFIFSDDKDFIEKEFGWIDSEYPDSKGSRITVVSGNSGSASFRDMQLMSMCNSNIIANSTFSVWAGLLNNHEDARIYYPKTYMQKKDSEVKTIPGWIRLG